jgi:hypothetical protein
MKWLDWEKIQRRTNVLELTDPNEIAKAGIYLSIKNRRYERNYSR